MLKVEFLVLYIKEKKTILQRNGELIVIASKMKLLLDAQIFVQ